MKIVYDHLALSIQRHGGVSRYVYQLATRMASLGEHHVEILSPLYINEYFDQTGAIRPRGIKVPAIAGSDSLRLRANEAISRFLLRNRKDVDIFHETYYSSTYVGPASARRVVTVYDMIHEKYPAYFRKGDRTRLNKIAALKRADHVICISESTRRDLLDMTDIPAEKTSVVYLGHTLLAAPAPAPASRLRETPYLLYVGVRRAHKNFDALLKAFAGSSILRNEFSLVCFGGGGLSVTERALVGSLGLRTDQVEHHSGDDSALARLYSGAAALVYPSLYEGFGIPPLEAMSFDCPVICANTSSLPEVVGDAAELFDPSEPEHMRIAMEQVVGSPARNRELKTLGRERVKRFSWERCARETLAVYEHLLNG